MTITEKSPAPDTGIPPFRNVIAESVRILSTPVTIRAWFIKYWSLSFDQIERTDELAASERTWPAVSTAPTMPNFGNVTPLVTPARRSVVKLLAVSPLEPLKLIITTPTEVVFVKEFIWPCSIGLNAAALMPKAKKPVMTNVKPRLKSLLYILLIFTVLSPYQILISKTEARINGEV